MKWDSRIAACLIATAVLFSPANAVAPKLKITENRRYLQYENGKPFFYLGDTAWELFHRLNREEATQYLANRAQKGFTVIQAVVLAQLGGLTVPNPYGDLPLIGGDPAKPNEAYFRHVDFIVNKAEAGQGRVQPDQRATVRPLPRRALQGKGDHLDSRRRPLDHQ